MEMGEIRDVRIIRKVRQEGVHDTEERTFPEREEKRLAPPPPPEKRVSEPPEPSVRVPWVMPKVARVLFLVALVGAPIAFLPFGLYPVSFHQQTLVFLCLFVAACLVLVTWLSRREILVISPRLLIILGAALVGVLVSAFLSPTLLRGLWGETGLEATAVISFVALFLGFIGASILVSSVPGFEKKLLWFMQLGVGISAALFVLDVFLRLIFGTPLFPWFSFSAVAGFNTAGTLTDLAVLMGLGVVLASGLLAFASAGKGKILSIVVGALALFSLLIVRNQFVFLSILVVFATVLAFIIVRRSSATSERAVNLFLVFVCVCFVFTFVNLPLASLFKLPAEVGLTFPASASITLSTVGDSVKNFVVGSGPATFAYDFAKFHSKDLNLSTFWNVNFGQAFSFWMTAVAEIGIVSTLLLGVFLAWVLVRGIRFVIKRGEHTNPLTLISVMGLSYGVLVSFFVPFTFVMLFLIFVLAGLVVAATASERDVKTIQLHLVGFRSVALSLLLIIAVIGTIFGVIETSRRVIMHARLERDIRMANEGVAADTIIDRVVTTLNIWETDLGFRYLSQIFMAKVADANVSVQDRQSALSNALAAAQQARQLNPLEPQNLLNLGSIYDSLIGAVGNASDQSMLVYQELIALSPNNPFYPLRLGQMYLVEASATSTAEKVQEYMGEVQKQAQRALDLKPDYGDASLLLSYVYENENRLPEAIQQVQTAYAQSSKDLNAVGTFFRLGFLYYENAEYENAKTVFTSIVAAAPNYSDALYFLGLTYKAQGLTSKALEQFQAVLVLNPGNQDVQKQINSLYGAAVPAQPQGTSTPSR